MDKEKLLRLAGEAFSAIEKNTGTRFWQEGDGLQKAVDAFNCIAQQKGLGGLIDAAVGSGMSHLGLTHWLELANTYEPDAPEIPSAILDAATKAIWDCSINLSLGLDGADARLVAQAILEAAGMAEFLVKDHQKTREINLLTAENRAQTARIAELEAELAQFQTSKFHPDWSLLEAAQENLREAWARIRELESELKTIARIGADDVPGSE